MTLPSSGQITMGQINVELGLSSTASNMNMNSQAAAHLPSALTQPHGMNEWYGYTHSTAPPDPTKVSLIDEGYRATIYWFQSGSPGSWEIQYSTNGSTWNASNTTNTQGTVSVPAFLVLCSTVGGGSNAYGRVRAWSGSGGSGSASNWVTAVFGSPVTFGSPCPFA